MRSVSTPWEQRVAPRARGWVGGMPGPSPCPSGTEPGASLCVPPAVGGTQPAARYVPRAERCCPEPSIFHPWRAGWADGRLDTLRSLCLHPTFAPSQPSICSLAGARGGRSPWTAGPHGLGPLWLEAAEGRAAHLPGPGRRASARGSSPSRQTSWCPLRCSRTLGAKGGAFAAAPDRLAVALAAWPTRLGTLHPPLGLGTPRPACLGGH